MISNVNYDSHKEEIELLQNILFEQITIREDTHKFELEISVKLDAENPKLEFDLKINLPEEYPNTHPIYEIIEKSNILPSSRIKCLNEKIKEFAEENLGFPMIYQIYEMVKDFGNEQEEILDNENVSKSTLEEESKKSYNNKLDSLKDLIETKTFTPVTKENFEVWFKKFYSEKNKGGKAKNLEMEQRMTGREYFMNLKNIKTADIENEGEDEEEVVESTSTNVNNTEDKTTIFFDAEAFEEDIDDIDFDNEEIDIDNI
jgi:hypothetical protein